MQAGRTRTCRAAANCCYIAAADVPTGAQSLYYVAPSTVPGAGLGIFAAEDLPRGTVWNAEDAMPENTVTFSRAQWDTLLKTLDLVENAGMWKCCGTSTRLFGVCAVRRACCHAGWQTKDGYGLLRQCYACFALPRFTQTPLVGTLLSCCPCFASGNPGPCPNGGAPPLVHTRPRIPYRCKELFCEAAPTRSAVPVARPRFQRYRLPPAADPSQHLHFLQRQEEPDGTAADTLGFHKPCHRPWPYAGAQRGRWR